MRTSPCGACKRTRITWTSSPCLSTPWEKKVVSFNMKPPHGTWIFDEPCTAGQFLDIKLNVRYGEPGNEDLPSEGKWTRFQRVPGSQTWMRIESDDLCWVVVLCPLDT